MIPRSRKARLNLFHGFPRNSSRLRVSWKRSRKWSVLLLIPGILFSIIRWRLRADELERSLHQTQIQWKQWQEIAKMRGSGQKFSPVMQQSKAPGSLHWVPLLWSVGTSTSMGVRVRKVSMGHSEETKVASAPLIEIEAEAKTLLDMDHWIQRLNEKQSGIRWGLNEATRAKGEFPLVFKVHGKT